MIKNENIKPQTLMILRTNFCQDPDSTVEKTIYEDGAEKIRAIMEKYIKELETSVHLHRTQNSVLRNILSWEKNYIRDQKYMTEKLENEPKELKRGLDKITKPKPKILTETQQTFDSSISSDLITFEK